MDYRLPIKGLGYSLIDFAEKASPVSGVGLRRQANNAEIMMVLINRVLDEMETTIRELAIAVFDEAEVYGPAKDIRFIAAHMDDIKTEIRVAVEEAVADLRQGAREAAE